MLKTVCVWLLALCSANFAWAQAPAASTKKIKYEALEQSSGLATYKGQPFSGRAFEMWPNNRIYREIGYENGLRHGEYFEYNEQSALMAHETWVRGQKNGAYDYHYPDGALKSRGTFTCDELDGLIEGFYAFGGKQYEVNYALGVRHGWSVTYYENGAREQETYFENGLPHGEVVAYYKDSTYRYIRDYEHGMQQGRNYVAHRSGCPGIEEYYKKGQLDSVRRTFDPVLCSLLEEGWYTQGQKDGSFYTFGFFGDTLTVATYEKGVLNGPYRIAKEHWDAEKLKNVWDIEEQGQYVSGELDGHWKHGFVSHYQQREGSYELGTMVGEWKLYDAEGYLLATQWYDNQGELIKQKFHKRKKRS